MRCTHPDCPHAAINQPGKGSAGLPVAWKDDEETVFELSDRVGHPVEMAFTLAGLCSSTMTPLETHLVALRAFRNVKKKLN